MQFVKSLSELDTTDLNVAGGKGANLGALFRAGLPVPPGFCVTTEGYDTFVEANRLQPEISHLSDEARADDPAGLEIISAQIRALFAAGQIPNELASEICTAYSTLSQGTSNSGALANSPLPVAVRSSATAEDLPDMSFAGQQDTYLNIIGEAAILDAVKRCWASLWTGRAIGYRVRNDLGQDKIALAVIIQQMIQSEASGVLFTANPLTGKRTETVVDATLGLGEALVSGQVDPDHYVVQTHGDRITRKTLGAKALSIHGQGGGGTITVTEAARDAQALPDAEIVELTRLGRRAVEFFKTPQDMEWAWAGHRLYVVQSRPITSLYPLPPQFSIDGPLQVFFSFGVIQGVLDPFTPLGQDTMAGFVVGVAKLFGRATTIESQGAFVVAGERLYVNITPLLRHPAGSRIVRGFISFADPPSRQVLEKLVQDPRLGQVSKVKLTTWIYLARFLVPFAINALINLQNPPRGRARLQRHIEFNIKNVTARQATATGLTEHVALLEETLENLPPKMLPVLLPAVFSGQAVLQPLLREAAGLPGAEGLGLALTRGLPHNVTTEMDLALWDTARRIKADAPTTQHFANSASSALASEYLDGTLPQVAQSALEHFLHLYGIRGIGEIDMGRPRWNEDPTHVMQVLKSYLQIDAPESSPKAVFGRGTAQAEEAGRKLVEILRQTRHGWLKARLARFQISRVRELVGLRETPKFTIVRLLGILRQGLLENGEKLVDEGTLSRADDLFFLHVSELKGLAAHAPRDWRALISERRQTYAREKKRRQVPRILLSDGTAFYEGMQPSTASAPGSLVGSPVSPGVVEGVAHVVLDPHQAQLAPGEILVCPATDPAWTPLFLAAGGLVMEVGGMMTHGSVVAREYGIPAVVGVTQATTRLQTGQRIRVDGSSGLIMILNSDARI